MAEEPCGPSGADISPLGPGTASVDGALPDGGAHSMGVHLEPVLRKTCNGRLSSINWFRTDWQRGGALTGYAHYQDDDGLDQPVVVKMPVPPVELAWLKRLQEAPDVVPRLHASGEALNGYDMAWVVMERLPHGPLGAAWDGAEFDLLVDAIVRFHAAADAVNQPAPVRRKDWNAILERARNNVHVHGLPESQRWNQALKKAGKKLKSWLKTINDRPDDDICHGDLHMANAMTRTLPPEGPALLIDLACVKRGHWLDDALNFEYLFWSRRERLGGRKLCSMIAKLRKQHGLKVHEDWPKWAQFQRALLAMSTPAQLEHVGDPHHVHAALEVLEAEVK